MDRAAGALYEPLIERDLDGIERAARVYLQTHSIDELWIAVARFSVLGYAPSQHGKRAVMACRAAHDLRAAAGDRWLDLIVECARYAAESRQPWSEPPILDPPPFDPAQRRGIDELRDALAASDRVRAETWLSSRMDDADAVLRGEARGDALLMLETAVDLERLLGVKGRYALLRMVIHELFAPGDHPSEPLDVLIDRAIRSGGAVDDVRAVFIRSAFLPADAAMVTPLPLEPYRLGRDYAQTLIAHAIAPRLGPRAGEFLEAVHHNLAHGESFADWSFA